MNKEEYIMNREKYIKKMKEQGWTDEKTIDKQIEEYIINKEEYIKKMKELGWPDKTINELVHVRDDAIKEGVILPFEVFTPEPPIQY